MLDALLDGLYSVVRKSLQDYCNLETTMGERSFVYRDGTLATIIQFQGIRRTVSDPETSAIIAALASALNPFFTAGAYELQFVLDRDEMSADRLRKKMQPMYESSARMGLGEVMNDVFDEHANTMAGLTMQDSIHIIAFTRSTALRKEDHVEWAKRLIEDRRNGHIHVPPGTQDETFGIDPLSALHDAFVDRIVSTLSEPELGGLCRVLNIEEASNAIAKSLDPMGTPDNWQAWLLPTASSHLAAKHKKDGYTRPPSPALKKNQPKVVKVANTSMFFPPPLRDQFLSREGRYTKDGGFFEYAGRVYSTVCMTVPPRKAVRATNLIYQLSGMQTRTPDGKTQRVPYRLSIRLRGSGMKLLTWRGMVAPLFSFGGDRNKKLMAANDALRKEQSRDMAICSISMSLTTWVNSSEPNAIQRLKSRLVPLQSAASQWGDMQVNEETIDRAEAFLSSCLCVHPEPCSVEGVGTLDDVLPLIPFAWPCSPLGNDGTELYRSLSGALMPTEAHSSKQDYWLSTITAPMGGGKSVGVNRQHFDFIFAPGRSSLPFLHIIDIGGSVAGMVELIQDALPADKKHLAYMHTLRNNRENAVNMLDPKAGLRTPLDGDLQATVDWLTALVTPAEKDKPFANMSEFCRVLLLAAYRRFDDNRDQSQPRIYKPRASNIVDEALAKHRIDIAAGTPWYVVADKLGVKGDIPAAMAAHRKGVPLLTDLHALSQDENICGDFMDAMTEQGTPIPKSFAVQLGLARESFPIFTDETVLDLRGRRVTAIDLGEVARQGSAPARKQSLLMYQVAYELFSRNIRITPDDMVYVPRPWTGYYNTLLDELSQTDKHVSIDEYHRTQTTDGSRATAEFDPDAQGLRATLIREGGREARKWQLSLTTISQAAADHGRLLSLASSNHIFKQGSATETEFQAQTLGLSVTDRIALKLFVNGPKKGEGVTFLSQWVTKDGPFNQLFTSTIGPKMLWSLSSTFEDKTIRTMVFEALGREHGRAVLAKHYPGGTAKDEVERRKRTINAEASMDAIEGACREIAKELIGYFRANPSNYQ